MAIDPASSYWIVPFEFPRIEVLHHDGRAGYAKPLLFEPGEELTTPLLPGLSLPVAALFEPQELV